MFASSLDTLLNKLLKVSKTTSPQTLFAYDCVTLYMAAAFSHLYSFCKSDTYTFFPGYVGEYREIVEFFLYREFPRPIWPAKYPERRLRSIYYFVYASYQPVVWQNDESLGLIEKLRGWLLTIDKIYVNSPS